jgi:hypothetical protein
MKQGATREQAVAWIKEDRERLAREALRGKLGEFGERARRRDDRLTPLSSPGNSSPFQLTSSPESFHQSEHSTAPHHLSSDNLFPLLPSLPEPAPDTHDQFAPTVAVPSYDHMKTLEALEQSDIWRQASLSRDEEEFAEGPFAEKATQASAASGSYFPSLQDEEKRKLQRWLIEELVMKRDAARVEEARQVGRSLGDETRRIWRHLDRSQMEGGPMVINGYNMSLASRFRDLQSPPPLSPPTQSPPRSTSALAHASHPLPQMDSHGELYDTIHVQDDPRADTPLPSAPRQTNVYQAPDDENPFTSAVREKPFQTFGAKFLPSAGGGDTTWTKETGKVLDLGGRPTLYRDRIGMANWGRTLLSELL